MIVPIMMLGILVFILSMSYVVGNGDRIDPALTTTSMSQQHSSASSTSASSHISITGSVISSSSRGSTSSSSGDSSSSSISSVSTSSSSAQASTTQIQRGTIYTVQSGDYVYLISQESGASSYSIETDNFLSSPYTLYPGQSLVIPASADPLATGNSQQDQYDQIFLAVAKGYNFNPMMMKAEVALESYFNMQAVSPDSPCGTYYVSGTDYGHSYGLAQGTPVCETWFAWPNGYEVGAPDLETSPNSATWTASAFNPIYAISSQGKAWSGLYSWAHSAFSGCSGLEYQEVVLAAYNAGQGAVYSCTSYSSQGQNYVSSVLNWYNGLSSQAGWTWNY